MQYVFLEKSCFAVNWEKKELCAVCEHKAKTDRKDMSPAPIFALGRPLLKNIKICIEIALEK